MSVLVVLAGCLTSVVIAVLAGAPAARAGTVPPPPPGWTTVFGDELTTFARFNESRRDVSARRAG